jgi:DNA polymerase-3 subunit delta
MILKNRADQERFLSGPPKDAKACLIYGRDRGGVRERADLLAGKVVPRPDDPFDTALLTEGDMDADGARLSDELAAISMLGGRRLVRLRLSGEKSGPDKAAAEALKTHLDGGFNPEAFFLVEAGNLGRDSALRRAGEGAKAGCSVIPVYEDEAGDVTRMIKDALAKENVRLTQDALVLLASRLPKERGVARQEIERLVLFLEPGSGATAGPDDLTGFMGVEPDASLSDAASDAFGGRLGEALAGLRRAFAEGEGGPAAVRAAGMHLQRLRKIDVLAHSGASLPEAIKAAGVFWKAERETTRQARVWTGAALDAAQAEILDADRACKTAGSPDLLLAERLFLGLAGRARRLGLSA